MNGNKVEWCDSLVARVARLGKGRGAYYGSSIIRFEREIDELKVRVVVLSPDVL